jgi:hypothetical protein
MKALYLTRHIKALYLVVAAEDTQTSSMRTCTCIRQCTYLCAYQVYLVVVLMCCICGGVITYVHKYIHTYLGDQEMEDVNTAGALRAPHAVCRYLYVCTHACMYICMCMCALQGCQHRRSIEDATRSTSLPEFMRVCMYICIKNKREYYAVIPQF